jgi:hypothetical protein
VSPFPDPQYKGEDTLYVYSFDNMSTATDTAMSPATIPGNRTTTNDDTTDATTRVLEAIIFNGLDDVVQSKSRGVVFNSIVQNFRSLLKPSDQKKLQELLAAATKSPKVGVMFNYKTPRFSRDEISAFKAYNDAARLFQSPDVLTEIGKELKLVHTYAKVRNFTEAFRTTATTASRPAPVLAVVRHHSCECDISNQTGSVVVSGCVQCCATMPTNYSTCKCSHSNKCNHPKRFDEMLFATTLLDKKLCTICSEYTNNCQHTELALDIRALFHERHETVDYSNITYVKDRIDDFNDSEVLFHRAVRLATKSSRSSATSLDEPSSKRARGGVVVGV